MAKLAACLTPALITALSAIIAGELTRHAELLAQSACTDCCNETNHLWLRACLLACRAQASLLTATVACTLDAQINQLTKLCKRSDLQVQSLP